MTGKGRELADMMDTIIRARDQMEGKENQKKQRFQLFYQGVDRK